MKTTRLIRPSTETCDVIGSEHPAGEIHVRTGNRRMLRVAALAGLITGLSAAVGLGLDVEVVGPDGTTGLISAVPSSPKP